MSTYPHDTIDGPRPTTAGSKTHAAPQYVPGLDEKHATTSGNSLGTVSLKDGQDLEGRPRGEEEEAGKPNKFKVLYDRYYGKHIVRGIILCLFTG